MAWKNLKKLSLADSLTSEHEALTELDDINEIMNWEVIEHLLGDIHAKRRGNSAWPPVFQLFTASNNMRYLACFKYRTLCL